MSEQSGGKKPKKNTWPDERVEILKKLWLDGLSASQIAGRLGDGITRNAVIGKVHRLGLSGRGSPTRVTRPRVKRTRQPSAPKQVSASGEKHQRAKPTRSSPAPRPVVAPPPIRAVVSPEGERIGILQLTEKHCRWPNGDPGNEDFCFCGHEPQSGTPYCEYHASLAYQTTSDRRTVKKTASV